MPNSSSSNLCYVRCAGGVLGMRAWFFFVALDNLGGWVWYLANCFRYSHLSLDPLRRLKNSTLISSQKKAIPKELYLKQNGAKAWLEWGSKLTAGWKPLTILMKCMCYLNPVKMMSSFFFFSLFPLSLKRYRRTDESDAKTNVSPCFIRGTVPAFNHFVSSDSVAFPSNQC